MSNPITTTIVDKLLTRDTSASSLVVGGATDTATTGTGTVAAGTVTDSVGTMATIRAGGLGLASQAALDIMKASSSSQWVRLAKGTASQYLRMNSGATDIEWGSIAPLLIAEASGTSTDAGAANVATVALASSLTIKDALLVFVRHRNTGNAANVVPILYTSTDSVTISTLSTANNNYYTDVSFISAQSTTLVGGMLLNFGAGTVNATRSTFSTNYTGAWTLALRHGGVTAPDTWQWEWAVYKIAGQ